MPPPPSMMYPAPPGCSNATGEAGQSASAPAEAHPPPAELAAGQALPEDVAHERPPEPTPPSLAAMEDEV